MFTPAVYVGNGGPVCSHPLWLYQVYLAIVEAYRPPGASRVDENDRSKRATSQKYATPDTAGLPTDNER